MITALARLQSLQIRRRSQEPEQQQDQTSDANEASRSQEDLKQRQCEVAWQTLGISALSGLLGGSGRGMIFGTRQPSGFGPWKLDPTAPPTPTPPCNGCNETSQKTLQDQVDDLQEQINEQQQENQKLRDENRQQNCRLAGEYSSCPEMVREEIPDHCEPTFNNPSPMCNFNPLDTKYCGMGEALWLIYSHWTGFPFELSFDAPKKVWDYFQKPSDYQLKCLEGQP